jgi:hypothetical protein
MSEEKPENEDAEPNKLKDIGLRTLETTIAKAISDLLGVGYGCEINTISYSGSRDDWVGSDSATFKVNLNKNIWREEKIKGQP